MKIMYIMYIMSIAIDVNTSNIDASPGYKVDYGSS